MRFSDLPPAAVAIWAKSGDPDGHGLLAHMLDVAAVAETILVRESKKTLQWAAAQFHVADSDAARWIASLVGLHDFGKAIPGFQAKWDFGRSVDLQTGLPFGGTCERASVHDLATAALLGRLQVPLAPTDATAWWSLLRGIAAHHGYLPYDSEIHNGRPLGEKHPWPTARQSILDTYVAATAPVASAAYEVSTPAIAWLAGLTSVSDWIGSNQSWFPPCQRHETVAGHFAAARELAEHALDAIGWPVWHSLLDSDPDTTTLLRRMTNVSTLVPRPLQAVLDQALSEAVGPALVVLEAPMGEGKTEAAFLAHLRLQRTHGHRGLYVALPTQATGNALFDRAVTFLRAFAPDTQLDIQLAHGTAMLDERVHRLRHIYGEGGRSDAIASSAWFSQKRRPLISPYGVGTIDQALFAVLNVKHHFVRIWGLANRVVVLDEIHAYDTYTSGLIETLLRWLKAMRCSVVLMSATLPDARRAALLRAWTVTSGDTPTPPYPRLFMADDGGVRGYSYPARPMPSILVDGIDESIESLAACAIAGVAEGGCGCVIVNTVKRAQALYLALAQQLPDDCPILLIHARFPSDERGVLEQQVLARYGKHGIRPQRALLIATQVVEQSLDIDFDFLVCDLAPMDLLLQRAGRLHRHDRSRPPAHQVARLTVAGLIAERLPETKATAWEFVYDPYILLRTWAFARQESVWHLPGDIDRLVQCVYGGEDLPDAVGDILPEGTEIWRHGDHLARVQNERLQAHHAAIDPASEPQNAWASKPRGNEEGDGLGIQNRTRLGDDALAVVPIHVSADGWRMHPTDPPFSPDAAIGDALAQRILGRQVRLANKAVVSGLSQVEVPERFAEHPLLRNLKPLAITEGFAEVGRIRIRLDHTLGIVYEGNTPAPLGEPVP